MGIINNGKSEMALAVVFLKIFSKSVDKYTLQWYNTFAKKTCQGENTMDKNEILEKSKAENKNGDEMYSHHYAQSGRLAMTIGILAASLITLLDIIMNSTLTAMAYAANVIMLSMEFVLYLSLAIKCKKRADIIFSIFFGIVLVAWLVLTVLYFMKGVGA